MFDSHIHLTHHLFVQKFPYIRMEGGEYQIGYANRATVIQQMQECGITGCIEPAIDVASNERLLQLSREYPGYVYPAVGNHPTRCIASSLSDFKRVRAYAQDGNVVAIGETGLDYHYKRKDQHRLRQRVWFHWQINLAHELGLPLVLHVRLADKDAIQILRRNRHKLHGGVCHCFGSGPFEAGIYTRELGLCLGIGGGLISGRAGEAFERAVKETPLEYLLLETDGPFVKPKRPEEFTKKQWERARNTSLILPAVAARIAELKGISVEEVMEATEENVKRVFSLS